SSGDDGRLWIRHETRRCAVPVEGAVPPEEKVIGRPDFRRRVSRSSVSFLLLESKNDQVLFVNLGPAEGRGDRVIASGKPSVRQFRVRSDAAPLKPDRTAAVGGEV